MLRMSAKSNMNENSLSGILFSRPRIARAISETVVFIYSCNYNFFLSTDFSASWADFRETLPHDAVCPEIAYLL